MKYPHRHKFWTDGEFVTFRRAPSSHSWYAARWDGSMVEANRAKSDGIKAGLRVEDNTFTAESLEEAAGIVWRDGKWVFLPEEKDI